jgi:hypothetical protein
MDNEEFRMENEKYLTSNHSFVGSDHSTFYIPTAACTGSTGLILLGTLGFIVGYGVWRTRRTYQRKLSCAATAMTAGGRWGLA